MNLSLPETVGIGKIRVVRDRHWSVDYCRQTMSAPDNHLMDYVVNCRPMRAAHLAHRSMGRIHCADSKMLAEIVVAIESRNFDLQRKGEPNKTLKLVIDYQIDG